MVSSLPEPMLLKKGKNVRIRPSDIAEREEGVSRNSLKTGLKRGRMSQRARREKQERDKEKIRKARRKAESHWETYLVAATPNELVQCRNNQAAMNLKLMKYDLDTSGYVSQTGNIRLPCLPVFFDSNTERGYIKDITQKAICCGIKPLFLIQKFVNVIGEKVAAKIRDKWASFMDTKPKAHNIEKSTGRSSVTKSYHLGIWRRSSKRAFITADTRFKKKVQKRQCMNFLRCVQRHVAPALRRLMRRYTGKEWIRRERMAEYIKAKKLTASVPELTTVAVTNGVSDIMHTDRNDAGLTWVVPVGKWEGGDLCIPQFGIKIPMKEGDAVAFQANFPAHMSSELISGDRLALTCFTDRNIFLDSMKWRKRR